jgi:hypothetical protein
MYGRTHVEFELIWKVFREKVFSPVTIGYKTLYLIVRISFSHHSDCQGGRPMGTWVLADLDNIICDFMGQMRLAMEQRWDRTKPDHYRAILAALDSALKERRELLASRATETQAERKTSAAKVSLPESALAVARRWSWRPALCLVPSRSQ